MRTARPRPPRLIVGPPRFAAFVRRYFPASRFLRNDVRHDELTGRRLHAAGDYLGAAFAKTRSLRPDPFEARPRPALFPRFGVCWRGGAAQNRREERRFALAHFLDLLPQGASYVALQADITEEERALLRRTGRAQTPDFDIRGDVAATFDMVSGLAGVIGVDSANWHMAGLNRIPIYAMMNAQSHWFWRPDGKVGAGYPDAETIAKADVTRAGVAAWMRKAEAAFAARGPLAAPRRAKAAAPPPVFITGVPRSGTSMAARSLAASGLWMGDTIRATKDNPRGFFENRVLRETILKPGLAAAGADPLGVKTLPDLDRLAPDPALADRVRAALRAEGWDGARRWGYKEPKLTLVWPVWMEAFPDAAWVVDDREAESIVRSCLRTGFMSRHSIEPEFWRVFVSRYRERLDQLAAAASNVVRISADDIAAGRPHALTAYALELGLDWSEASVAKIDPALFGRA